MNPTDIDRPRQPARRHPRLPPRRHRQGARAGGRGHPRARPGVPGRRDPSPGHAASARRSRCARSASASASSGPSRSTRPIDRQASRWSRSATCVGPSSTTCATGTARPPRSRNAGVPAWRLTRPRSTCRRAGPMSEEDLERYESPRSSWPWSRSTGPSSRSSPTSWRPSVASTWPTRSRWRCAPRLRRRCVEVNLSDAWVWDMYRTGPLRPLGADPDLPRRQHRAAPRDRARLVAGSPRRMVGRPEEDRCPT